MTASPKTIEQQGGEEGTKQVRYRAFHTSPTYNSRLGIFDYCDLYELEALRVPISMDKVEFYRDNPNEPIITPAGEDGHIIQLDRERSYYAAASSSKDKKYIVVPKLLRARRFKKVSSLDLETWESESNTEEGIIFVGALPAIAIVREIFEATGEIAHTTTSDRSQALSRLASESPDGSLRIEDEYQAYNYEDVFKAIHSCGYYDCPICYGDLKIYRRSKLYLLGEPIDSPALIKEAKRRKLTKLLKFAKYAQLMTLLNSLPINNPNYSYTPDKETQQEQQKG
jgi:hypothetical protein